MTESLLWTRNADRRTLYSEILPQLRALTDGESDRIANISNIVGALKQCFGFFWVGVYFVKGKELVLGPFQGPIACTRISFGRGVCGAAWKEKRIILVPDVEKFPGHIACSSESKSEIVLPATNKVGDVFLVLDVDSDRLEDFSERDSEGLGEVIRLIETVWERGESPPSSVF